MSAGTTVELTFEGLVPRSDYSAYMAYYNGYQGFNFEDLTLITRKDIVHNDLTKDGFGNVLHGDAEVYLVGHMGPSFVNGYAYGWLSSSNTDETFDLKSGIFAAAINNKVQMDFRSYEANGGEKADIHIDITKKATTIDFANYGNDFKHITAVEILSTDNAYPYPAVMDNIKVHWNGAIPDARHPHFSHLLLAAVGAPAHGAVVENAGWSADSNFHSALTTLTASSEHVDAGIALTSQFMLPGTDHFGTW
jgi:hypothetical protein